MGSLYLPLLSSGLLSLAMLSCTGEKSSAAQTTGTASITTSDGQEAGVPGQTKGARPHIAALRAISPAIPIYSNTRYREDLSRRDAVSIKAQFGPDSEVFTLSSDDSFPQVWHYYVVYLAQFRAYRPPDLYPNRRDFRSLEIALNPTIQDPFIPGETIPPNSKHVILQVIETESDPPTVIRYIVTRQPLLPPVSVQ